VTQKCGGTCTSTEFKRITFLKINNNENGCKKAKPCLYLGTNGQGNWNERGLSKKNITTMKHYKLKRRCCIAVLYET
jgi:hypothetical protein